MDLSWLNGMAPFMVAASVNTDRKVNSVRLVEAAISAIIIAIVSTSAAAYVTLRIVESQTAQLVKSDDERGRQVIGILTQMATVQAQLASVSQQQASMGREMHERLMAIERRSNVEPSERFPRSRP
jgi:hypothetical protein